MLLWNQYDLIEGYVWALISVKIQRCMDGGEQRSCTSSWNSLAPFTQRSHIIAAAVACQYSTIGSSHRAKHFRLEDELLFNSHRKPPLWLLKGVTVHVMMITSVCFLRCFPGVLLTDAYFGQKCDEKSKVWVEGQTLLQVYLLYFFSHISWQRD